MGRIYGYNNFIQIKLLIQLPIFSLHDAVKLAFQEKRSFF